MHVQHRLAHCIAELGVVLLIASLRIFFFNFSKKVILKKTFEKKTFFTFFTLTFSILCKKKCKTFFF